MNIPIVHTDFGQALPEIFNTLSNSSLFDGIKDRCPEDVISYLMGYDDFEDLQRASISLDALPIQLINIKVIYTEMLIRGLFKFGIKPISLYSLLLKVPMSNMGFYKMTDAYQEEQRIKEIRESGYILARDEGVMFERTHPLFLSLYKEKCIPEFEYAVNRRGEIYIANDFERNVSLLSDPRISFEDVTGINDAVFIKDYILPLAWIPLDGYLSEIISKGLSATLPYGISLYTYKKTIDADIHDGYLLYNNALHAFYPVIVETELQLSTALKKLFMGEVIDTDELSEIFNAPLHIARNLNFNSTTSSSQVSFDVDSLFCIGQQQYIPAVTLQDYDKLAGGVVGKYFQSERDMTLHDVSGYIDPKIYKEHRLFKANLKLLSKNLNQQFESVSNEAIHNALSKAPNSISLCNLVGESYLNELSVDDINDFKKHGEAVFSYIPALKNVLSSDALGYLIDDREVNFILNNDELGLIGYVVFTLYDEKDGGSSTLSVHDEALIGRILLLESCKASIDNKEIYTMFKSLKEALVLYIKQEAIISTVEGYKHHLDKCKKNDYLSNGVNRHNQEASYKEVISEMFKLCRKYNVKIEP